MWRFPPKLQTLEAFDPVPPKAMLPIYLTWVISQQAVRFAGTPNSHLKRLKQLNRSLTQVWLMTQQLHSYLYTPKFIVTKKWRQHKCLVLWTTIHP